MMQLAYKISRSFAMKNYVKSKSLIYITHAVTDKKNVDIVIIQIWLEYGKLCSMLVQFYTTQFLKIKKALTWQ